MEYKVLATEFTKKGFNFKQVWREGDFAIYEQSKENVQTRHFEAIKISKHNGFQIGGVDIPPSEVYPGDSKWGEIAFTEFSVESARKRIEYMKHHADEISSKNKEVNIDTGNTVRKTAIKLPDGEFSVKMVGELNPNIKSHNIYPYLHKLLKSRKIKETKRATRRGSRQFFIKRFK